MENTTAYGVSRVNYKAIDAYKEVSNPDEWLNCPKCNLKPLVWMFDNGRSTACGCGASIYDHPSVYAESIMSHMKHNNGSCLTYDIHELQKNWNHWVQTGEYLFPHHSQRTDNRW